MSTKVKIDPGVCGLITEAEAIKTGRREVKLIVKSSCGSITKMFETLGEDFNSFELCLVRPGERVLCLTTRQKISPCMCLVLP